MFSFILCSWHTRHLSSFILTSGCRPVGVDQWVSTSGCAAFVANVAVKKKLIKLCKCFIRDFVLALLKNSTSRKWKVVSGIHSNLCIRTPASSGFLSTKASLNSSRQNWISSFWRYEQRPPVNKGHFLIPHSWPL